MSESLATTLRGYLGDNPLVLMENADGTTRNYFLSDPELETAAREVVKRVAPACIQCGVGMIFAEAADFRGWSCMETPRCVFRIPLQNTQPSGH